MSAAKPVSVSNMPITLTTHFASSTAWPQPGWHARSAVQGQPVWVDDVGQKLPALRWIMRRNCSITPGQLLVAYLSLCAVTLTIAAGFFLQGAQPVLAFAGVELLALGVALMIYARHAGDHEILTLCGRRLQVLQHDGHRLRHADFRAEWVAVEPSGGQGSLVDLSGQGRRVRVGRFLHPEMRGAFAHELRMSLRRACLVPPETDIRIESQDP